MVFYWLGCVLLSTGSNTTLQVRLEAGAPRTLEAVTCTRS
jgi:hypothetical protein